MSDCLLPERAQRATGAMFASAKLICHFDRQRGCSYIDTLRSDGPLVLRKSNPKGPEPLTGRREGIARVALAAGTAGPIGGDAYSLDVTVGADSTLLLQEVSAMLILPGSEGHQSKMAVTFTVEDGATFVWWSEPIIAAHMCNHLHVVPVELAEGARLIMREELLLGRHGETPGDMSSRLRITRAGAPLYDLEMRFGPSARGWASAAVLNGSRAVGSIIAVDQKWKDEAPRATPYHANAALAPLAGRALPSVRLPAIATS